MSNINISITSTYETGKIRGFATATIDDGLLVRGIKIVQAGPEPSDVNIQMPQREGAVMATIFSAEFEDALYQEVCNAYLAEIGEMAPESIQTTEINCKNLDVFITKMFDTEENPSMRAKVNVKLDELFSINDVEVRSCNGTLEVAMPKSKTLQGYQEISSFANYDFEKRFKCAVLATYSHQLSEQHESSVENFDFSEREKLKFYMPLTVTTAYAENEYGKVVVQDEIYELSGSDLMGYDDTILQELDMYHYVGALKESFATRGLMAYYGAEDSLDKKANSMHFSIERVNGALFGVAIVQISEPLTPEETSLLKDYITGQASDGFGEAFEQQSIKLDDYEVEVSLWNQYGWSIKTAEELGIQEMSGMTNLQ